MSEINRSVVILRPKQPFLDWGMPHSSRHLIKNRVTYFLSAGHADGLSGCYPATVTSEPQPLATSLL